MSTEPHKKRPQKQMSEAEKLQNFKIIQSMNQQINFQKNPRYATIRPPIPISQLPQDAKPSAVFTAFPSKIVFQDYHANNIYQTPLVLTNRSHRFQRIRVIPPGSAQFSIIDIEYPSQSSGDIAPGMSVSMKVNFNASSLQDFEDLIQIITEEDCLNIQVVAKKEQPLLNLQEVMVCPSAFLGDRSSQVFRVVNKGGGAGFKMFELGQEEPEEVLEMEHFSVFPTEFYLDKGQSINLNVTFHPKKEGSLTQNFTLACDNLTNAEYTLKGTANIVEFQVIGLDDQTFEKNMTLSTIFFNDGLMNHTIKKDLIIKNLTSVQVNYHWDIHKSQEKLFQVDDGPKIFWIEPQNGVFPPQSQIRFSIYFNGYESVFFLSQIPYFENLSMVIEDVPIESVKNINLNLKDKNRSSLTYLSFQIVGLMQQTILDVSPTFYTFPQSLNLKQTYKHTVYIKNESEADTNFKIIKKLQTCEDMSYTMDVTEGKISSFETIVVNVEFTSTKIQANQQLFFWVKFDSNEIKAFQLQASFIGPQVNIVEPLIDYGIVKPYSTTIRQLTLQNMHEVPCEIVCRNADPLFNLKKAPQESDKIDIYTNKRFTPTKIVLAPNEKKQIDLVFQCQDTQIFNQHLEFQVQKGDSHVVEIYSEVQEVYVSLNRYQLSYPELYLGEKYEVSPSDTQSIVLQNRGNIATNFRWVHKDLPNLKYAFEPASGVIQPKEQITIHLQFTPLIGPELDEIFVCQVDNLEHPLGIQLKTKVLGLEVKYELIQPQMLFAPQNSNLSSTLSRKVHDQAAIPLELIDFTASKIKQISTLRFTLTNTSGINTRYDLEFEKYEPAAFKEEKVRKLSNRSMNTMRSSKKSLQSTDSVKANSYKLEEKLPLIKQLEKNSNLYLSSNKGIALTCEPAFGSLKANQSVEVKITLYNDICGLFKDNLYVNVEGLPSHKVPVEIKVTGSPIMLAPNQVGINLSGEYPTINMGTVIRGTGPIEKNFNLINNGPSEAEIDIKLYNVEDDLYEGKNMFDIKLGEPMLGSEDLIRLQFDPIEPKCIENDESIQIFPKHARIKGRSQEHFKCEFACSDIKSFNYLVVLRPKLISDESQNLGIVPILLKAETIQPHLILDKKVDFNNNQTIKFQRWSYGDSTHETQTFFLINDTKTNLIFHLGLTGPFKIIESSTNSVLKYDLLGTSGMQKQKVQTAFNLSSLSSVQLKILFENDGDWPMNYRSYKKGELSIKFNNDDVQKILLDGLLLRPNIKLNMKGYEGDVGSETIDFGTVHVRNQKFLTFYVCNQTKVPAKWKLQQVKYPKLKNQGLRTMTNLEKEDELKIEDPSVFDFNIVEGVLNGPSIPLQQIANGQVFSTVITDQDNQEKNIQPQTIKIRFMPKKSVLYKCKYRIMVEEGPYQDFILKGNGTLDEVQEI